MPPRSRTPIRRPRLSPQLASFGLVCLAVVGATIPSIVSAQMPTQKQMDEALQAELPDDPAATVAIVGQSAIVMGEISPKIEARIQEVLANAGQEVPDDQIQFARVRMTRGLLAQTIQSRMMRESFLLDQVATQTAEKRREAEETMQAKARQMFFEDEVVQLKKQYEAKDLGELDAKLREKGTSLAARQREFIDAMLGHLYIRGKVNKDPSVSLAEIHGYYHTHSDDFRHAARARWEQLTVLYSNFPNKQAAYDAIWAMGREAFFGGSMQAVAREKSQEPFADEGGQHNWTNKGSLASAVLEEQIFSLPTGAMSQIIEDTDAYHIVRVLEREDAGITALADVQDDIRNILRDQKIQAAQKEALAEVQRRVPVWSLFPEDIPGAKPLPRIATQPFPKPSTLPR
ncbi:peptidylprolyl isomerase [Neorhodopirellula pilleata]|uniref:Periplasmic chaperone PpiD n=2 Tax=Neorhodopirellula pilleata TaxID=2714738 RepID=A0A5C5ZY50_9BACT|nr:peptidylprolyl isomerase [Neorhodopirellula pilleata]